MKRLYTVLAAVLMLGAADAQSYNGTIEYEKKKQSAIVMEYSYSTQAVENAFIKRMQALGYKAKEEKGIFNKDKGFIVFKSAFVKDISDNSLDYIIKVERKSRKDNDRTVLYLIMNNNGSNALDNSEGLLRDNARNFLQNLVPDVEAANLELQIQAQEDVVTKAEKKLRGLQDDQKNMEDKIKKLQDDLKSNAKDQDNQQKEIEAQKAALEALRGKRKA